MSTERESLFAGRQVIAFAAGFVAGIVAFIVWIARTEW